MREVPSCLNRRYKALDELIQQLSSSPGGSETGVPTMTESSNDPGIKLMCEFWNILKEDPDCNLTQQVKQRMGLTSASTVFRPQRVTCYMAKGKPCCNDDSEGKKKEAMSKGSCCQSASDKCCASKSGSPTLSTSDGLPLSKVLCNLKEAASFDKKCSSKINELMDTQKDLMEQIGHLEHREKEGVQLLKQADCMWSCMEDAYKKRVEESLERQKNLIKQLKEVETSNSKWRKTKKDLELQMSNISKCQQEIVEKESQKKNDIKCMDSEIADFKKRIESNKKDAEASKKSLSNKKQTSDNKIASIALEVSKLQKSLDEEYKTKSHKEEDGKKYVKEAREDLQKICRVLLQKKLQNEDLRAEKQAILEEICLLNQTMDLCKDRCKNKQTTISDEIKKLEGEIATFKVKCIRCHQCTDTMDVRKLCTDCPRCAEERDCILEDDHCSPDSTMDCVCMTVKQKFLDNVFDNMYTVLARQSKTGPGKSVAEVILKCLKRSRNGKLNDETKKILQDFILHTVKKNLNLTIVGGAVKTRCEMDPDTYKQLMLCLKQVTAVKPPKTDKGTLAKKESCRRWGGTSECNCPSGPKACVCTKKAPPPPKDPNPCPPIENKDDIEDPGEVAVCPHKESTQCGPDCAMHAVPSGGAVGTDVAQWRPDPCSGPACPFSKTMRAAQCVLGPESLNSVPKTFMSTAPYVPDISLLDDTMTCSCGKTEVKPCTCREDPKQPKRCTVKFYDKSTCATVWDPDKDDVHRRYSLIEKELRKESYAKYPALGQTKYKETPSVQVDVFSKGQYNLDIDQSLERNITGNKSVTFADKKFDGEVAKDQFRILTGSSDEIQKSLTELTKTSSGTLAIALDEKVIEIIDKKTSEDPNIIVSLKKTDSGQFNVNFSAEDSTTEDAYRVLVNRTPSGTRTLEVHKNFVNKLQAKDQIEIDNEIKPEAKKQKKHKKSKEETACSIIKNKNSLKSNEKINSYEKMINNLLHKFEDNTAVDVKVIGENGPFTEIKAPLTKTLSGNIAVDVNELSLLGEINFKERAVVFKESESGSCDLNISPHNESPNAVIRKTPSGGVLVVLTNPVLKSMETTKTVSKENFYNLKIKHTDCEVSDPAAILKTTPSQNYVVVIDKEYEKGYQKIIDDAIEDNTECYINLLETGSGNYLINFDDNDRCFRANALLIKSEGNIKIVKLKSTKKRKCLDAESKVFSELLSKLPISYTESFKQNRAIILSSTKSSSDSNLYQKVKILTSDQTDLLSESLASLKKTSTGQYAVVLGKESKKVFLNNLKNYLKNNYQGLIPVKKTEAGEITIVLSDEQKEKSHYGSLKITPSGNIYVMVDEKLVKEREKDNDYTNNLVNANETENCSSNKVLSSEPSTVDTKSTHLIGQLKRPVNKSVTTTCNANPDTCCCDPSKCVCEELQCNPTGWAEKSDSFREKPESLRLFNPQMCGIDWRKVKRNPDGSYKICDPDKCLENCCNKTTLKSEKSPKDTLTHIVIKPCACNSVFKKNPHAEEQCYFVEPVCPYHGNRYDSLSNDLIEISGLCKKPSERNRAKNSKSILKAKSKIHRSDRSDSITNWNSLHLLPPQLPAFLGGFEYR